MKATVTQITSASQYSDGKRRVTLTFDCADKLYQEVRVTEDVLGRTVAVDEQVEFNLVPVASVVKLRDQPNEKPSEQPSRESESLRILPADYKEHSWG